MLEQERKFTAPVPLVLPDLRALLPPGGRLTERPPVTLTATYHDTADLRLARAEVSLRYRRGDPRPWTVKLPTGTVGVRQEISVPGSPGTVPDQLVDVLTATSRGAPLFPSAVLRTTRRVTELRDAAGELLAEVDDDTVAILDGPRIRDRFREIEVERHTGGADLLDRIAAELTRAGAVEGPFVAKHRRALDPLGPPELTAPGTPPDRSATAGAVVTFALRQDIARIVEHDPWVRLGEPLPDGDTAVHQMRVGCRRLRSDLRVFRPLLDRDRADRLRAELSWLADLLGAARDAEVLRARLARTAAADPLAPLADSALSRLDGWLGERQQRAQDALSAGLRAPRYLRLLDLLMATAADPPLTARADRPASELLPRLAARAWRTLAFGRDGISGAAALDPGAPDQTWHQVRIRAKRARYTVDAVTGTAGRPARRLARRLGRVQDLLGEHQDAVVAAETWLAASAAHPADRELAVTAGRLVERERAAVRRVRAAFPKTWRRAGRGKVISWLP